MPTPGERPLVMGVLNVTPDSFSDGGRYVALDAAVAHGLQMVADGADIVDVGGESTRPGAVPVPEEEELRRVVPVIDALAGKARVSIDTTKPGVARAAVAAGATVLNDISGTMWPVAAELSVGWVGMHMRGTPVTMQGLTTYDDVVREVHAYLLSCADRAAAAGVKEIWLDPGIGFAKTDAQNLMLLAALGALVRDAASHGARVLVGTSRKGFLGRLPAVRPEVVASAAPAGAPTRTSTGTAPAPRSAAADPHAAAAAAHEHERAPAPAGVLDRFEPSLATAVWAMAAGVQMVRVHDVAPTVQAATLLGGAPPAAGAAGAAGEPRERTAVA